MKRAALLIELFTEELPPLSLMRLAEALATQVQDGLARQQLIDGSVAQSYATPRRLAVLIPDVADAQSQRWIERKGPSRKAAHTPSGDPSPALLGFTQSCGATLDALHIQQDAKGQEYYVHRYLKEGEPLTALLPDILENALKLLPVAKVMRWGAHESAFVRPVHGLVALHGTEVLPISLLGLTAGRTTQGHRVLGSGTIIIDHAIDYESVLERKGYVVASFATRRQRISAALERMAHPHRLLARPELLDEVSALVEWPVVYEGHFDPEFLQVPQDCLILSMQQHQKYFPLGESDTGKLVPRFLVVSNLETSTPHAIIQGNERVLRARLADARFFFEQDKKIPLAQRLSRLSAVVYQQRLGSLADRVERLVALTGRMAHHLSLDSEMACQAARLMKADLVTEMVGEFPELQGRMGMEYARLEGQPSSICEAIGSHYQPRFAGDVLPDSILGRVLALADKLETLVGIYGVGLIPTGDRDPFALRRATLGILRLLIEGKLPLTWSSLLKWTEATFPPGVLEPQALASLPDFIQERLRGYLRERGYESTLIDAITPLPDHLASVPARLDALKSFRLQPEAQGLAAAHKRVRNLLKKSSSDIQDIPDIPLQEPAEIALEECLRALGDPVHHHLAQGNFSGALHQLAQLHSPVERFFEEILVLCPDPTLRNRRLGLLVQLESLMTCVGDLSCLKP